MAWPGWVLRFSLALGIVVQAQLPSASMRTARVQAQSWQSAGSAPANTAQEAIQGIAGLMQRFEQMQPRLGSLPERELQAVGVEGQQLHERFLELQQKLQSAGASLGPAEDARVLGFHKDLAVFVEGVETKLGVTGPQATPSLPPIGNFGGASAPRTGGAFGGAGGNLPPLRNTIPAMSGQGQGQGTAAAGLRGGSTDQRLQTAMSGVANGMQRFEALHPRLRSLPQQLFTEIATQGQRLHEEFTGLQQRGVALAGDGSKQMAEADGAEYASQMESFVVRMQAFVGEAEAKMQDAVQGGAGNGFGYAGMVGNQIPMPSQGGAMPSASLGGGGPSLGGGGSFGRAGNVGGGSFGGGGSLPPLSSTFGAPPARPMGASGGLPPLSSNSFGGSAGGAMGGGGQITPATDRRLSAVIEKVVSRMKDFEALKPQFSRLPQQAFTQIAQRGQELNDRFVRLQQTGQAIAGDGSRPMSEQDASGYVSDMESFEQDQAGFVDQAKQAIQSGGSMGAMPSGASLGSASLGSAGFGSPGLGSASLPGGSLGSNFGGSSLGGSSFGAGNQAGGSLGASSFGGGSFGGGSLGGGSLGARGFGGGSPADNTAGGSLSGRSFGSSGGRPTFSQSGGSLGSFGAGSLGSASVGGSTANVKAVQDSLKAFGDVKLDVGVLPPARTGAVAAEELAEDLLPEDASTVDEAQCSNTPGEGTQCSGDVAVSDISSDVEVSDEASDE